ncbi:potassium channel family protein [Modestobacter sp. VKM Ac-2984]|uniref:potassium channel family protein n=1 Tax=Modestobacter sp. VKM Ac-2984 TaxID=3004138 RepID=UPI0022AAF333|nr:potassium channel family protein [Modestobacter sp. VKM Ac-2984]MCZ2817707.1 potassium channel family protein [Modestobacter sp. VKM Ac-2984]
MTGWWWDVIGVAIVAFAVVDEVRTTLAVASGPGPLTQVLTRVAWRLTRRPAVADSAPVRFVGGPGVILIGATLGAWFTLLWVGWSLVFLGGEDAVVGSSSGAPASVWERFYFAGYNVATLGNGGYQPAGAGFQLATMASALSGMLLITLAVSYLTQVISAVVGKRSFASQVTGFGSTGAEMAAGLASPGTAFPAVVSLSSLSSTLTTVAQQHRAYPLLHAYRPRTPELGTAPAVAVVLDAVLVLSSAADPADRLPPGVRRSVLSAVQQYVTHAPTAGGEQAPPAPALDAAETSRQGLTVDPVRLAEQTAESAELRDELSRRITAASYDWPGTPS